MFTGIVTGVGRILVATPLGDTPAFGVRLRIAAPAGFLRGVRSGDSIALSGACMTVTAFDAQRDWFEVEVSAESLARTAGLDGSGDLNLELALSAADRLGGHLVSGHVDGIGRVAAFEPVGESWRLEVTLPTELARFMAEKGSIVVDGVSLTINSVDDDADGCRVAINLIPHTLASTTLGRLRAGKPVNIEVDLIARYVDRLLQARGIGEDPRNGARPPHSGPHHPI